MSIKIFAPINGIAMSGAFVGSVERDRCHAALWTRGVSFDQGNPPGPPDWNPSV